MRARTQREIEDLRRWLNKNFDKEQLIEKYIYNIEWLKEIIIKNRK